MNETDEMSQHSLPTIKSKYENVLQHMDSGIALFDDAGILSFINLQMGKLLGVPRKALLGYALPQLLRHPQLPHETRKLLLNIYRNMYKRRTRYFELTHDDSHLLVTATYGDELDGDVLIDVKDVTDYKNIEQTAYRNDKLALLGKIAASIAHEIRNPLTSIRGFIQMLKPDLEELGKARYGDIILAEIDYANEIINEFLNSSKPTAPIKHEISVGSLINEVVILFESEALLKGFEIISEPIESRLQVWIDIKQIKHVLLNIMKNAADAIHVKEHDHPGFIRIEAEQSDANVHICIQDNGNGMDQTTLSKLFDPFFTTKEDGSGLGLPMCYRIMKNHGGTIHVESQLNAGTTFNLVLPLN